MVGIEKHPGFHVTPSMLKRMAFGVMYGDLMMSLINQCSPYEVEKGLSKRLAQEFTTQLSSEMKRSGALIRQFKRNALKILDAFDKIEKPPVNAYRSES